MKRTNLRVVEPTTTTKVTVSFYEQLMEVRKDAHNTYSFYRRESSKIKKMDKVIDFIHTAICVFGCSFILALICADWLAGYESLTTDSTAMMTCCISVMVVSTLTLHQLYKTYRRFIVRNLNKCCREEVLDSIGNNFDTDFYIIEGGPDYEDQEDLIDTVVEMLRDNDHEYYDKDNTCDFDIEEMVN